MELFNESGDSMKEIRELDAKELLTFLQNLEAEVKCLEGIEVYAVSGEALTVINEIDFDGETVNIY